ncbi:MAG: glycosyltransferase [Fusobacteriaceae bacterium]
MELSIVVPIYNVEEFLRECLDTLYRVKNIDKEIILVNDGTKDNSMEIIREYEAKYPLITVVVDKPNGGLSSARNAGLKVAKGKYVSFIDSDDFIDSELFEKFFKEGQKDDLDIIIGNAKYFKDGVVGSSLFRSPIVKEGKIVSGLEFLDLSFGKPKCFREEVWDDIYKRDFLLENNLFFYEGLIHEDSLFTPLAYLKAKKVRYIDSSFYFYRQREGGIMSKVDQRSIDSLEKICDLLVEEYEKLDGEVGKKSLSKLIISFYKVVVYKEHDKNGNYKEKYKKYRSIFKRLKGCCNGILNETLLYVSLNLSIILRKALNKEITNKQKLPQGK